ncbi:MAG: hypothetical protein LBM93_04955 [Oscillospiraceae bacterium]|nr:hypothetical protein [Oscillospiraceae bacterium]
MVTAVTVMMFNKTFVPLHNESTARDRISALEHTVIDTNEAIENDSSDETLIAKAEKYAITTAITTTTAVTTTAVTTTTTAVTTAVTAEKAEIAEETAAVTEVSENTQAAEISYIYGEGERFIASENADMTAYYYKDRSGVLRGGSGRELIPGYSVGCLIEHHKEMYGKIVKIYGTGLEGFEERHFRIDDCGYGGGDDEFLIDFYAGTGEQYLEYLTAEQLRRGRYRGLTVEVIGEWDTENNCEILY